MLMRFMPVILGITAAAAIASGAIAADKQSKPAKKPASACAGLALDVCGGKAECHWFKQITMKNGKTRKAHCRKKPTHTASVQKTG